MSLAKVLFWRKPVSCLLLAQNIGHHFPSAEPTALPCLLRKWRLQTYIHSPLKPYNPQTCARHPSPAFLSPSGYNARHGPLLSKNHPSLDLASLSPQPFHPSRRSSTHCCELSPHTLSFPLTLCNSHLETHSVNPSSLLQPGLFLLIPI